MRGVGFVAAMVLASACVSLPAMADEPIAIYGLDLSMTVSELTGTLELKHFQCAGDMFQIRCRDSSRQKLIQLVNTQTMPFKDSSVEKIVFSCEITKTCGMSIKTVAEELVSNRTVPAITFVKSKFPTLYAGYYEYTAPDGTSVTVSTANYGSTEIALTHQLKRAY